MQDDCERDHTVVLDQWEDEDGDIITVTETCDLDTSGNELEIIVDDDGIEVNTVLVCRYGDCGNVEHRTNIITI